MVLLIDKLTGKVPYDSHKKTQVLALNPLEYPQFRRPKKLILPGFLYGSVHEPLTY